MKPHLALLLLLGATATSLPALDTVFLEPVIPVSPTLKAQGGTSTANATGFSALFANPAAFAEPRTEITVASFESSTHIPLSGLNQVLDARDAWSNFDLTASGPGSLIGVINGLISTSTVGQEFSSGSAWVGNNLGVGFAVQGRGTVRGVNLLDAKSHIDVTAMGIIGMAWPFEVGMGTLRLGGAIRPMQRMIADVAATDLLKNASDLSALTVSSGFGMGMDLGVRWDYLGFQTGAVVRDASGTVLNFKEYSAADWQSGLGFPSGGSDAGTSIYRVPTVLGLGTAWTPDVGTLASLFQPTLSFDLQIPLKDEFTQPSFWTWTHLGAEAKLLRFFSLRAGLNQGYATFGMGVKLFVVDFNLAVYSDELGRYAGVDRRSGLSAEWAIRL